MGYRGILLLACFVTGSASAATINVPADQSTIQAAIDAANNGDMVLVAPGTYYESLDFKGKAITVKSSGGAAATVLDGNGTSRLVYFHTSEGNGSVLQGFTLTHAYVSDVGSAIYMISASPTIIDNIFESNKGDDGYWGAAIGGNGASPVILRNYFADNTCGWQANSSVVGLLSSTSAVIADNIFVNNPCPALQVSVGTSRATMVYNNTVVGNRGGLIISSFGTNAGTFFSNNLIAFNQYGLSVTGAMPAWGHNLVYGNTTLDYQGVANQAGLNGNISSDPVLKYWQGGDVHLLSSSPAIDAGDNSVSQISVTDFYGNARTFDGNGDGTAIVDIGAVESVTPDDVPGVAPVINVPADQPTIQAAIDAASDGDVVLVAPGIYYEQLDPEGKTITVKSSGGAVVTILDGSNNTGPTVNIHYGEGNFTVLQGFTLVNGYAAANGSAVSIFGSSPSIVDDRFVGNYNYGGDAAAIHFSGMAPVFLRDFFSDNKCSSHGVVAGSSTATLVIADSVFSNNTTCTAILLSLVSGATYSIYNNTIVGNFDGIVTSFCTNTTGLSFVNNVVAFNHTVGFEVNPTCGDAFASAILNNLVYGNTTANYQGVADQTGTEGNLSADPLLKDWSNGDVHLLYGSPAIDVGDTTVTQISATDLYGNARVFAGMPGDSALVDIGAVEYQPPVVAAADGSLAVTLNTTKTGTLSASGADSTEPLTYAIATQPMHGMLTLTDAATGAIQYVPANDYLGTDSFTFTITDPYGTTSSAGTEQVTISRPAPTANASNVSTTPDTAVAGALSVTLAFAGETLTYSLVSNPTHGTVSLAARTGKFTYTPATGYVGGDSFTFQVTDNFGIHSNVAAVSVTVNDVAPKAQAGSGFSMGGRSVRGQVRADIAYRGQVLHYSVSQPPSHGGVKLTASGAYVYTPARGYRGRDSFTYQAIDQWGTASNTAVVKITVR